MIWRSLNVRTYDNAEVLLFGTSQFKDNQLKIEIIVQYLDDAKVLFTKSVKTHIEPNEEDISIKFDSKFDRCVKLINNKNLSILFGRIDF